MKGYRIGNIYEDLEGLDEGHITDARITKLIDLINKENEAFSYDYDFKDGWDHTILFFQIVSFEDDHQLPFCISGALKCPPEDCGGIYGFHNFLAILSDKRHPEYKETKIWGWR